MNAIKPLAQTPDTVTLSRADFDALLYSAEEAVDLAAVDAHRAYEERVGWETARQSYLTAEEVRRLLDGESAVRIWRVKRGLKQQTLAEAAKVWPSYLAEIEGGKKPGSAGALQQIAMVLEMPVERLIGGGTSDPGWRPVGSAEAAATRLIVLARQGAAPDRMAEEMRTTITEWRHLAGLRGLPHRVKAGLEMLTHRLAETIKDCSAKEAASLRDGDHQLVEQMRSMERALGAALDSAYDAYAERSVLT